MQQVHTHSQEFLRYQEMTTSSRKSVCSVVVTLMGRICVI